MVSIFVYFTDQWLVKYFGGLQLPTQLYEKEKILDACFKVFVKNGYVNTTTAMLAEAAGISKALIFHHFKSKKNLYISVLERCYEIMAREKTDESLLEYEDFFEAKEKTGLMKVGYLRKNPDFSKLLFEAFYKTPEELKIEMFKFKTFLEEKYGEENKEQENQMKQLFMELSLRDGVDSDEAYELVHVISEYFRMKLAAELTDEKKVQDDEYWKAFFKKKNSFLNMVRFGIENKK